jgi:hypothetical protein
MVNFHDPAVVAQDYSAYAFAVVSGDRKPNDLVPLIATFVKLWHTLDGVYL